MLITYDEWGGYGHPDHIQAHRVAMYGCLLAAAPHYRPDLGESWSIARVLWNTMSASRMRAALKALRDAGDTKTWEGFDADGQLPPMVAEDSDIDVEIDGTAWVRQKPRPCAPTPPRSPLTDSFSPPNRCWATVRGRTSTTGSRPAWPSRANLAPTVAGLTTCSRA